MATLIPDKNGVAPSTADGALLKLKLGRRLLIFKAEQNSISSDSQRWNKSQI